MKCVFRVKMRVKCQNSKNNVDCIYYGVEINMQMKCKVEKYLFSVFCVGLRGLEGGERNAWRAEGSTRPQAEPVLRLQVS